MVRMILVEISCIGAPQHEQATGVAAADGHQAVKWAGQSVYGCLGIRCGGVCRWICRQAIQASDEVGIWKL